MKTHLLLIDCFCATRMGLSSWDRNHMTHQACDICYLALFRKGFPDSSVGKESACNAGDPGLIPGLGRSPGEGMGYPLQYSLASLVAQLVKNPSVMWDNPWVGKIPWRREQLPTPLFWSGEFHGLYNPWGPWGPKELDMTEQLSLSSA